MLKRLNNAPEIDMLVYHRTSLMTSSAQTVVNTVNCVGVMGKGIAAEFKQRHPAMFREYKEICDRRLLEPGKLWLWQGPSQWVLNFPTKKHWRSPSRIEWIEAGLKKFVEQYQDRGITEVAFPRLGCGNGGLSWDDVRPLMESYLGRLPIPVYIHDYEVELGLPEHLDRLTDLLRPSADQIENELRGNSFEGFSKAVARIVDIVGSELSSFDDKLSFVARIDDAGSLILRSNGQDMSLDSDDVRGIWLTLHNSMVTASRIRDVAGDAAPGVFSILSLLPAVRLVQVQKRMSEPEAALELLDRREVHPVGKSDPNDQLVMTWP